MIKKWLPWIIALLYFLSPYDALPDFIVGLGWLDDLAVLGLAFWWASRLKRAHGTSATWSDGRKHEQPPGVNRETDEKDPYKVLGLQPGASREEIRTAYKKLAAQYHPDKVQHLGEEFQQLAHEKFVPIQKAYDRLMK